MLKRLTNWIGLALVLVGCSNPLGQSSQTGKSFFPGIFFSELLSTLSTSSNTVPSGESVTLTLTARDTNGKPFTVAYAVVFETLGVTSQGSFGSVTNQGGGVYQVTYTGSYP